MDRQVVFEEYWNGTIQYVAEECIAIVGAAIISF